MIALAIGGASEMMLAQPRTNRIILKKRRGFVKLAIKNGYVCLSHQGGHKESAQRVGTFGPESSLLPINTVPTVNSQFAGNPNVGGYIHGHQQYRFASSTTAVEFECGFEYSKCVLKVFFGLLGEFEKF